MTAEPPPPPADNEFEAAPEDDELEATPEDDELEAALATDAARAMEIAFGAPAPDDDSPLDATDEREERGDTELSSYPAPSEETEDDGLFASRAAQDARSTMTSLDDYVDDEPQDAGQAEYERAQAGYDATAAQHDAHEEPRSDATQGYGEQGYGEQGYDEQGYDEQAPQFDPSLLTAAAHVARAAKATRQDEDFDFSEASVSDHQARHAPFAEAQDAAAQDEADPWAEEATRAEALDVGALQAALAAPLGELEELDEDAYDLLDEDLIEEADAPDAPVAPDAPDAFGEDANQGAPLAAAATMQVELSAAPLSDDPLGELVADLEAEFSDGLFGDDEATNVRDPGFVASPEEGELGTTLDAPVARQDIARDYAPFDDETSVEETELSAWPETHGAPEAQHDAPLAADAALTADADLQDEVFDMLAGSAAPSEAALDPVATAPDGSSGLEVGPDGEPGEDPGDNDPDDGSTPRRQRKSSNIFRRLFGKK